MVLLCVETCSNECSSIKQHENGTIYVANAPSWKFIGCGHQRRAGVEILAGVRWKAGNRWASGNYTLPMQTTKQAFNLILHTVTGSEISYTPPDNTKQVIYVFKTKVGVPQGTVHGLYTFDYTLTVLNKLGFDGLYHK